MCLCVCLLCVGSNLGIATLCFYLNNSNPVKLSLQALSLSALIITPSLPPCLISTPREQREGEGLKNTEKIVMKKEWKKGRYRERETRRERQRRQPLTREQQCIYLWKSQNQYKTNSLFSLLPKTYFCLSSRGFLLHPVKWTHHPKQILYSVRVTLQ